MRTKLKTITIACILMLFLCVPCMASCSSSTPDVYGAFSCNGGNCTAKIFENGSCGTTNFYEPDTGFLTGNVEPCDSSSGGCNSVSSWYSKLFGDSNAPVTPSSSKSPGSNFYGNFAANPVSSCNKPVSTVPYSTTQSTCDTVKSTCGNTQGNCTTYDDVYAALRADNTEKKILSDAYTSKNFAQDVCEAIIPQGINCNIVKVTFTDGSVNYLNSVETCNGTLMVDSCGTSSGTGIKKVVNTLEVGKQWSATSLFNECTKTYTRGIVKSIE